MKAFRSLSILMLVSWAACLCFAEKLRMDEQRRFDNRASLEKWAERESFGGHDVQLYSWQKCEVLVVQRHFTSGTESCMLSFYVKDKEEWVEAMRLRPWYQESLRVRQDEDAIRILAGKSDKIVGIVSISGLQVRVE